MNKRLTSSFSIAIIFSLVLFLSGCGKDEKAKPKVATPVPAKTIPIEKPTETSPPAEVVAAVEPAPAQTVEIKETPALPQPDPEPATAAQPENVEQVRMLGLAKRSGCLACHSVDKKMVGPAWKDVAARYEGKSDAKTVLLEKVSKGGKGNWTELTGGVPMPPYYPRVTKENIEQLVDFILTL